MSIHGGIDQYDRDSTMDDFKSGNIKLLVSCVIVTVTVSIRAEYLCYYSLLSSVCSFNVDFIGSSCYLQY